MRKQRQSLPGCLSGQRVHRGQRGRPRLAVADAVLPGAVGAGPRPQEEAMVGLSGGGLSGAGTSIQIGELD